MTQNAPDFDLLTRWLLGEPAPGDEVALRAWRDAHPGRDAELAALAQRWAMVRDEAPPPALPEQWEMLRQAMYASANSPKRGERRARHLGWVAGIAGVVIACLGGLWIQQRTQSSAPKFVAGVSYTTGTGQLAMVDLPDGTQVTLAPHSTLVLEGAFSGSQPASRRVRLTGEAYFAVVQHAGAPFTVQTTTSVTRVLGTEFSIRQYVSDPAAIVAVVAGKVVATPLQDNRRATAALTAGMVAVVSDSNASAATVSDLAPYRDWTQGRLAFRDAPVGDVLGTVGRWYGYEFKLTDSLMARQQVTTTLDGRTPQGVLRAISLLLDVQMTVTPGPDGRSVVTLMPRTRREMAPARRGVPDSLFPVMEVGR